MSRKTRPRLIALLAALLIALTPVLAAAEPAAVEILAINDAEQDPEEVGQLDDGEDPSDGDGEPEAPGGETQDPEAPTDGAEAPEAPADEPQEPGAGEDGTRTFTETVEVSGATWKDVNLVRAKGFKGKLAIVAGKLTLNNVQIEGKPAEEVNLLDYFDLAPKAAISCAGAGPLRVNFSALSVNKGDSRTLKLRWNGKDVDGEKAAWTSSNEKYVKVKDGKITAKKQGSARVTAKYKNQTAVCYLDITGFVYPEKIKLDKTRELSLNNSLKLKAKLTPKNVTDPTITWSSSNPNVVSIDEDGSITGLAVGKATVTATASNGIAARCKVTVKVVAPKKLDFKKLYVTMHPGEDFQTVAALTPSNTSNKDVRYESSAPSVAAVDENGVITALACGTATVTATSAAKPGLKNTCKVCVIDPDGPRLAGLIIGINPGHQIQTIKKKYPIAPGSHHHAKGVKTGASGFVTHQHEYEVVLQIGLKLRDLLEADGATVVMTRTKNDVMLTNIDRARMLNAAGVDVALQLHNNATSSNRKKTGVGGYVRTTGDWVAESIALSNELCRAIRNTTGFKNRGLHKFNGYMSLNWTTTPSVLLEIGYLSNPDDDRLLAKDAFRQKVAQGIYDGLCAYFDR